MRNDGDASSWDRKKEKDVCCSLEIESTGSKVELCDDRKNKGNGVVVWVMGSIIAIFLYWED